MGYELHITLADNWLHSTQRPIAEAAWMALVDTDPSLEIRSADYYEYRESTTGEVKRIHPVVWTAHPKEPAAFWFMHGEIRMKNPDDLVVEKMKEIATKLGANLLGDEGEEY